MSKTALPRKPSALIRIALEDLKKTEQDPRYDVNMYMWHQPSPYRQSQGKCEVCFAGSVMAQRLGARPTLDLTPGDFPESDEQLEALNQFRDGAIARGLQMLNVTDPDKEGALEDEFFVELGEVEITDYHEYPDQFKQQMEELAQFLEGRGL